MGNVYLEPRRPVGKAALLAVRQETLTGNKLG